MKRTIEKEITVCDACEKGDIYTTVCLGCGREFCYDCAKNCGVTYYCTVYLQGGGDGFYCNSCDDKFRQTWNPVHAAYLDIASLRQESKSWSLDFESRRKSTEAKLKALRA